MSDVIIRPAREQDLPALLDIYNYEVANTTATFDIEPWTLKDRRRWFDAHDTGDAAATGAHPLIVAEKDGEVVGYASLSAYRDLDAYDPCAELSVYVQRDHRRQGIARQLVGAILDLARTCPDLHLVISVIAGDNEASFALHRALGFAHTGTTHECARKFGRWLDIEYWELLV